ncbi:hypothetical protein [Alienimonas sp. DA493]|uniref:hypothetical protein n=1 Tax=Alienimonas sp. DA493 TaxID=3373605 RepID=UPI003753F88F
MANRIFYFVEPAEPYIRHHLNAIRLLCDPRENKLAHVTVRGPYESSLSAERIDSLGQLVKGEILQFGPIGEFVIGRKINLHLECECDALKKVWDKSDFGYRPHLTIFDGTRGPYMESMRRVMLHSLGHFKASCTSLVEYPPPRGRNHNMLAESLRGGVLSRLVGFNIEPEDVGQIPSGDRFSLISRLCQQLSRRSSFFDQADLFEDATPPVPHLAHLASCNEV